MVDRQSRDRFAELLRQLCSGAITIDAYESEAASFAERSVDLGIRDVFHATEELYDDETSPLFLTRFRGRYRLSDQQRRELARSIVFLHSDVEYAWPENVGYPNAHGISFLMLCAILASLGLLVLGIAPQISLIFFGATALSFFYSRVYAQRVHDRWVQEQRKIGRDYDVWPFHQVEELDTVLLSPRLLAGPK